MDHLMQQSMHMEVFMHILEFLLPVVVRKGATRKHRNSVEMGRLKHRITEDERKGGIPEQREEILRGEMAFQPLILGEITCAAQMLHFPCSFLLF